MFKKTALLGGMLSLFSASAMAITVTTTNDADTLANTIAGSGITITNATYNGGVAASGTFIGDAVFGLGEGIVLTSGSAQTAADTVNNSDSTTVNSGTGNDADLDALVGGGTQNATSLEFDFTTDGGDLFFDWSFASEEYNEYVETTFNDVFAFFVNGINIALAPDGEVASINTINCGNPFGSADENCSSFNNNDLQDGGPFFSTEYDGFTDVLTASVLGLGVGTHHIKIAIADRGDSAYDSAVFIKAGSCSDTGGDGGDGDVSVPEPGILALLGLGLAGMTVARRRKLT
jgi:hypothetical protein